eukprot:TRINITY_DN66694_c0_g1_i1.p1 TRINITY_DN66694_c0_g1~~TRINITY_DN66694_c0_g1_i1.p1  ORF type:complete len:488 (+),score=119.79 TRINITY_DN66694_c0_g1_i1:44-1507(+)
MPLVGRFCLAARTFSRRLPCARPLVRGMASSGESSEAPAAEQAAKAEDTPEKTTSFTPRELYKAALERSADGKTKVMQGAGASLALGGAGILLWQHWAVLASWNLLGGGLMAAGAALAQASSKMAGKLPSEKPEAKFKLTLLNDPERWRADSKALGQLLGAEGFPGAELKKAGQAEKKKEMGLLKEALQEQSTAVKKALEAGETVEIIQARLRPRTFVFDFQSGGTSGVPKPGSMKKLLEELRDTVTFILHCSTPYDEVVVRINSPGGGVADYGLAAAQLLRLRREGLKLTACVDKVAASGGYMMACVANTIVATPFSFVGSIGVLAQLPNFSKLLQRNDVDFLQFTGGRWKRTVDPFASPTEEGLTKMQEDVERIHDAFKGHVVGQRQGLDIEEVATGEVFLGLEAKDRGLVDALATSDEVLAERMKVSDVVEVSLAPKKKGIRDLLEGKVEAAEGMMADLWQRLTVSGGGAVALESRDPKIQSSL